MHLTSQKTGWVSLTRTNIYEEHSALKIYRALLLLILIVVSGTLGYHLLEGWEILDSFYMTLITITTIGYSEVQPLSHNGRIFTSLLIILGVGTMGYTLGSLTQFLVEGQIRSVLGKRKMVKSLQEISDHYIVCGYGRVGIQVCKQFILNDIPTVVIEGQPDAAEQAGDDGFICIQGDATDEEVLLQAGIKKAKAIVAAISSDASNVFITLCSKGINPEVFVVVRVTALSSEKKMIQAGADRVISPDLIGGQKMAMAAIHPNIVEFMDIITPKERTGYRIEEIVVKENSKIAGKMLLESKIRNETGVMIIGIRKNGDFIFNPPADTLIQKGNILIAAGSKEQLDKLPAMTEESKEK